MEQRYRKQGAGFKAGTHHLADDFGVGHGGYVSHQLEVLQCLADGGVGRSGTFRLAGSTRGIHDHCQVFAIQRHLWRLCRAFLRRFPARSSADVCGTAAHHHRLAIQLGELRTHQRMALYVADHQTRPGVVQCIAQFFRAAPAVERHHDRARCLNADKCEHPLRVVAHGDGNPVALANARLVHQIVCKAVGRGKELREGVAFIFVGDSRFVAMGPSGVQRFAQGGRCIGVTAHGDAIHAAVFEFEGCSGSSQLFGGGAQARAEGGDIIHGGQ